MFDMHNDLLSIAYRSYTNNNYEDLKSIYQILKKGNINYVTANLYFMTREEMQEELGDKYYQDNVSVIEMFKLAKDTLNKYMPDINFKYSIEGCDYVSVNDLVSLKELGLTSIMLVWNNPNRYGSGNRDTYGLTNEGILFIKEAMHLHLYIDVSHANKNTCMDILKIIKEEKYPLVYASHSNIRTIFDHSRNLDDEELSLLKEVNGKLGLVLVNYFAKDIDEYIEHIKYAIKVLGIDNVMIASDNMEMISPIYKSVALLPYEEITSYLRQALSQKFNNEQIDKILYKNSIELFRKEELL